MQGYNNKGVSVTKLLLWAGLANSTYYYKYKDGKPGVKASMHTITTTGEQKENKAVVQEIEVVLRQEFCCYGYRMMSAELQERGYIINHKKVYRLMKENRLLFGSRIQVHGAPRNFIRYRKIAAQRPLEYLCMDIKYVHIHGEGKNALLLTIMDVYSRKVLLHMLRYSIKKGDVLLLLSLLLLEYKPHGMTLRSDNGSQFIAGAVRQYLKEKGVYQEFTHVATPQDNSYIEALHSSIQREVVARFEFESLSHAQNVMNRYYFWYNGKRKHWALNKKSPLTMWNDFFNPYPMKTTNLLNLPKKTLQLIRG